MNNKISHFNQSRVTGSSFAPKRVPLKMVASTYEPPEDTEDSLNYFNTQKTDENLSLEGSHSKKDSAVLERQLVGLADGSHPGLQFIHSLLPAMGAINFDEGDCIPVNSDDRWVITGGQVKVVGNNMCFFCGNEGFIFFASAQTKNKIKEVVAMQPTTAYRLSGVLFRQKIRNFLYVKNSQKIKFLKLCPFLSWSQTVAEDLALSMELMTEIEKNKMIYHQGETADYLYFVKEGVVLLERAGRVANQAILQFEKHYEASYLSEQQGLIVVRRGMLFGADGILIKQITSDSKMDEINPEDNPLLNSALQRSIPLLKDTRMYTAKCIGKCELYRIHKSVVETYLKDQQSQARKQQGLISHKELDRICMEYTNLLMGSQHSTQELKKKNLELRINLDEDKAKQSESKKRKIQEIRSKQKRIKKNTTKETKNDPVKQPAESLARNISAADIKTARTSKQKNKYLPTLNNKLIDNLLLNKLDQKQSTPYVSYRKKIENELSTKQPKNYNPSSLKRQNNNKQQIQCMKVRSYRSLLSSMS